MSFTKRKPSLIEALIPVIFLIGLLSVNVKVFGDDALAGSNQIVLILSAAVAALIAKLVVSESGDILSPK